MELKIFENPEFGKVRVKVVNGVPMFCGKDVASSLGYSNTNKAIGDHVEEEDKIIMNLSDFQEGNEPLPPHMKSSKLVVINESGVYSLVFGSQLESAKRFKKWVTSEVLPSIRKNGMYATDVTIEKMLNDPDFAISLLTKLKEERQARIEAENKNAILTHVNKTYTATEIAKELGFKSAIELNKKLEELKIQYKMNETWVLYSKYSSLGYEQIKQEVLDNGKVIYHRRFTQLGREFLLNLLSDNNDNIKAI